MKEQEPKDVEWIKGTITTTCKAWADRERFAVFYKGDFISFYNKCLEQGKAQALAEFMKIIDECPCGRKDREWINVKELKAKLQEIK